MKILITFIIILLNITTSVFADKISFKGSGFSLELPDEFMKYDRSYLLESMQTLLLEAKRVGIETTEKNLLTRMDILEENNVNAFFDKKNYFNAISFYLMTNLGSFTEEEIQNEETIKELKEVVAKKNGLGDSEFTTFEVSTIFVGGKKGHRMTYNIPPFQDYLISDAWIEVNDRDMLRILYSQTNTDPDRFVDLIENLESTLVFDYPKNPFLPKCKMLGGTVISFSQCNYQIEAEDGTLVAGEANDGFITGLATVNYPTGEIYRGTLVDGTPAGYGKVEFPNGNIIVGDFLDFFKKGVSITKNFKAVTKLSVPKANSGVLLKNDNRIYVGGLKDGYYHGEGMLFVLRDDEKQEIKKDSFGIGIWENNKLKVNYRSDIEKCEYDKTGSIKNDFCFNAEVYDDIEIYGVYQYDEMKLGFFKHLKSNTIGLELGFYKNNLLHGYGYASSDLSHTNYIFGEFKEGSLNGYGAIVKPNKSYFGEFKNSKPDGFIFYEDDGNIMGIYREGRASGYFENQSNDGRLTAAQYQVGGYDGLGYHTDENETYVGEFKNSKYEGYGVKYAGSNFSYDEYNYKMGLFKDDKLIEELVFCKKLFGDYYTNPKSEGCLGNDNVVEFREFILDKNDGLGESWLEEYYKKERIKLD